MQQLFGEVVSQFQSTHQYQKFIKESQKEYDIKIYRFQKITIEYGCTIYSELKEKYASNNLAIEPQKWHENQRRLYVWFIVCYIHMKLFDAIQFIDGQRYQKYWKMVSETFWGKDILFLKYQLLTIIKKPGRASWKKEEEELLKQAYSKFEKGQWNEVAKYFYIQSRGLYFKNPKQCRQRWQNHLNNDINKGEWTEEQDKILFEFVGKNGPSWARIIPLLKSKRTEHMIKNRYKSITNKIMHEFKVEEKEVPGIYLKKLNHCDLHISQEDNKMRDQHGIQFVQSEDYVEEPEPQKQQKKEKKKRGRKPKNVATQQAPKVQNSMKIEEIQPTKRSITVSNGPKNGSEVDGCIIEGFSLSKRNPLMFNSYSGGFPFSSKCQYDSFNHSIFNSNRFSMNNGFAPVLQQDRSLFFDHDSLKIQKSDKLEPFSDKAWFNRSRRISFLNPNDSFPSFLK